MALVNIIAATFCGLAQFVYRTPPKSLADVYVLIISGIVISGLSYSYYVKGLRQILVERALVMCLVEPILNPIWVYLGKGEIPSEVVIIGISFILLGTLIDILLKK